MEPDEYRKMAEVEDAMWYYHALHHNLLALLDRHAAQADAPVLLDAGCGTGGFLRRLRSSRPQWRGEGIDLSETACRLASERCGFPIRTGSAEDLPYADQAFDAVISADVLCNVADPTAALREMRRCTKPGGLALVNVPAYPWLWSYHDEAVHSRRRFYAGELQRHLREAGWRPVFSSHWNCFALPLIIARRKWLRPSRPTSDVRLYPSWAEAVLRRLTAAERRWMRRGIPLPAGSSVLVAARRAGEEDGSEIASAGSSLLSQ